MKDVAYLSDKELLEDYKLQFSLIGQDVENSIEGTPREGEYWANQDKIWKRIKDIFREIQRRGL